MILNIVIFIDIIILPSVFQFLRHVVYGPSRSGYEGQGFGPLTRALYMAKWTNSWDLVQPALSGTIARIEAAVHLLTGSPLGSITLP